MIDIVIPMYNAVEYSKRCVASIRKTLVGIPYRMHLLDNGSTDDTRLWLENLTGADVEIQTVPLNLGAPKGKNIILGQVQPRDYVLFIDNDIEFLPGWLKPFLDLFAAHEDAGIVGIEGYNMTIHAEHRSLERVLASFPCPCHILRGCLMMARGELVSKLGGFDEKCGMYWHDDDDFCIRAIGAGYQNYVISTDKVIHHESRSSCTLAHVRNLADSARVQKYLVEKWRHLGLVDPKTYQPRSRVLK